VRATATSRSGSFRLADAVGPQGHVYAVEVTDALVEELRAETARRVIQTSPSSAVPTTIRCCPMESPHAGVRFPADAALPGVRAGGVTGDTAGTARGCHLDTSEDGFEGRKGPRGAGLDRSSHSMARASFCLSYTVERLFFKVPS
jgi:hypothetical protein